MDYGWFEFGFGFGVYNSALVVPIVGVSLFSVFVFCFGLDVGGFSLCGVVLVVFRVGV